MNYKAANALNQYRVLWLWHYYCFTTNPTFSLW